MKNDNQDELISFFSSGTHGKSNEEEHIIYGYKNNEKSEFRFILSKAFLNLERQNYLSSIDESPISISNLINLSSF